VAIEVATGSHHSFLAVNVVVVGLLEDVWIGAKASTDTTKAATVRILNFMLNMNDE
jgi:hypothetical protein